MAEEFENYEARVQEAHRAVERWEADDAAEPDEQGRSALDERGEVQPGASLPDTMTAQRTEADRD